jgi:leucyl aminopeptidase
MSPRTPKQFKEIREEKRNLIMDTALEHFASEGYYATTINHIAKHAGISKGLMYNYFESKEALLKAIIQRSVMEVYSYFDIDRDGYLSEEELAESLSFRGLLGTYQYNEFKTLEKEKIKEIGEVFLLGKTAEELKSINRGTETGRIVGEAVCMARDLVNGPSNKITPTLLSEKAQGIAKDQGMELQVFEVSQAEAMGMGAFTAVAKGSQEPGKFIVLEYNKGKRLDTIALVGKGITFDSGGISIKPSEGMDRMKDDMSGAAAVLATLQAAPSFNYGQPYSYPMMSSMPMMSTLLISYSPGAATILGLPPIP